MSQYLRKTVAKKRLSVEKTATPSHPVTANGTTTPPPPPPGSSGQSADCSASHEPSLFDTHPLSVEALTELTELLEKIRNPDTTQQVKMSSTSSSTSLSNSSSSPSLLTSSSSF